MLRGAIVGESIMLQRTAAGRRDFGLQLFQDQERLRVRTLFGSLTDPACVSERPDAAAAPLIGRVAFLWAGAVLHVRASHSCS